MDLIDQARDALRRLGRRPGKPDIVRDINDRLNRQWEAYEATSLLGSVDTSLFPEGTKPSKEHVKNESRLFSLDERTVSADGQKPVPFRQFFQDSWSSDKPTHLFVTGAGGIGKTVALLRFATDPTFLPPNVPAIYIPLHRLAKDARNQTDSLDAHLRNAFPDERQYNEITRLSMQRWVKGPNVILLLDGHNEVSRESRGNIDADIADWATNRPGVQLVVTSRIAGLQDVSCVTLELQPLPWKAVRSYLKEHGVREPKDSGCGKPLRRPSCCRCTSTSCVPWRCTAAPNGCP